MSDLICISCWNSFDRADAVGAAPPGMVACPHCGFVQPGPAGEAPAANDPPTIPEAPRAAARPAAPARPDAVALDAGPPAEDATASVDPFAELPEELGLDLAVGDVPPGLDDDSIIGALLSEARAEAEQAEAPSRPAARPPTAPGVPIVPAARATAARSGVGWWVRTGSGLLLHFPAFDLLARWANKRTSDDFEVTYGEEAHRSWTDFKEKLRRNDDPVSALKQAPPAARAPGEESDGAAPMPEPAAVPGPPTRRPKQRIATASTTQRRARAPRSEGKKKSPTTEFTFRTTRPTSPWPGRLLFLTLGLATGGGVVYYLAWLGIMPGIQY